VQLPILFMTGHADVSMAVQAMKSGASDFIEKPFKDQMLLDTVAAAIRRSAEALEEAQRRDAALAVLAALSPREKEAARLIARGLPNKLIAASLGISEKTVHIHRQHIMEKAAISSAAELARLMLRADPAALD
jgi:FixJ family two-component response regulator